jgi:hypothetical protein
MSSLPVKRGGSLSFLMIFTVAVPVIGLDMTEILRKTTQVIV